MPAALLLLGPGLNGLPRPPPEHPNSWSYLQPASAYSSAPYDPRVRILDRYERPPEYARSFARAANKILLAEGVDEPPWGAAVASVSGTARVTADPRRAVARLAELAAD